MLFNDHVGLISSRLEMSYRSQLSRENELDFHYIKIPKINFVCCERGVSVYVCVSKIIVLCVVTIIWKGHTIGSELCDFKDR
jgi:hypothetical protein